MNEYINREELMDARQKAIWVYENANILNARAIRDNLKPILDKIVDITAADVAEVNHGRWYLADDGDGLVCSECGEDFCNIYFEVDRFKYCPNCGAYMRETYRNAF